jgi:short-subunit dehydrogenase
MVGLIGLPRQGAYVAAKFGVVGLSEALWAEMGPHGVGVSVVCPARVRSNLLAGIECAPRGGNDGMDPSVVAARVVDAIRHDVFYVITHPEHKQLIADRAMRLLEAFDRALG